MSVEDIKKMLKTGNLILGSERTLKALRNKELTHVYLASNAPSSLVKDVEYYAAITGVVIEKLDMPNDELGVLCKKPFNIACIGLKKVVEKKKY